MHNAGADGTWSGDAWDSLLVVESLGAPTEWCLSKSAHFTNQPSPCVHQLTHETTWARTAVRSFRSARARSLIRLPVPSRMSFPSHISSEVQRTSRRRRNDLPSVQLVIAVRLTICICSDCRCRLFRTMPQALYFCDPSVCCRLGGTTQQNARGLVGLRHLNLISDDRLWEDS